MSEESLVQPEGVNAGSAEAMVDDGEHGSRADVRRGGHPEKAPTQDPAVTAGQRADPEMTGAPAVGPEGSVGQDNGNQ